MNILEVSHVAKSFGGNEIIKDLSFSIPEHCVFGFIGKNGAGKTTTMKMILGLLKADKGEIYVNGERVTTGENTTNRYIGYLPDVPEFYGFMTPAEYLKMCGQITGMKKDDLADRVQELLQLVGLKESGRKRIKGFSRGMKQRLGIAQALLNRPKLLICDEPTSALDPIGRKEILDILCESGKETTIIFSTHILSDVERICDRVAFLNNGQIALCGTLDYIRDSHIGNKAEILFTSADDAARFISEYDGRAIQDDNKVVIANGGSSEMLKITECLSANKIAVKRLEQLEPTLEDLFLEVNAR